MKLELEKLEKWNKVVILVIVLRKSVIKLIRD